jgi:hypothetical protein
LGATIDIISFGRPVARRAVLPRDEHQAKIERVADANVNMRALFIASMAKPSATSTAIARPALISDL